MKKILSILPLSLLLCVLILSCLFVFGKRANSQSTLTSAAQISAENAAAEQSLSEEIKALNKEISVLKKQLDSDAKNQEAPPEYLFWSELNEYVTDILNEDK